MDDTLWNHVTGARSKRADEEPTQQPMRPRGGGAQVKAPSADQKKVRRQMTKSAAGVEIIDARALSPSDEDEYWRGYMDAEMGADQKPEWIASQSEMYQQGRADGQAGATPKYAVKESSMSEFTEVELLARMAAATTLSEQSEWGERLNQFRAARRDQIAAEGSLDWSAMGDLDVSPTFVMEPRTASLNVTADSDWLADMALDEHDDSTVTATMRAEATLWYEGLWAPVKGDAGELAIAARNAASRASLAYGDKAGLAKSAFLAQASHLNRKEAQVSEHVKVADMAEVQPGPYVIPNSSSLPNGVDNDKTFDEIVNGEAPSGQDPKTEPSDSPSLQEGDQPEKGHEESAITSPVSDTDAGKFVTDTQQGTSYTDPMPSGGTGGTTSSKTAADEDNWAFVVPDGNGKYKVKSRGTGKHQMALNDLLDWGDSRNLAGTHLVRVKTPKKYDDETHEGEWHPRNDKRGGGKTSSLDFFTALRLAFAADEKTTPQDSPSLQEGDQPETGHQEPSVQETPSGDLDKSTWGGDPDNLNTGGTDGSNAANGPHIDGTPSTTARRKTAGISVKNVGIDSDGNGTGTTSDGTKVKFRLSDKDRADLKAVLYSDLAMNFSGVEIEQSDIITEQGGGNSMTGPSRSAAKTAVVHAPSSETVWDGDSEHTACDPEKTGKTTSSPDDVTCEECRETLGLDDHTASKKTAAEYQGGSPKSGDTATCHADGQKIEFFDGAWYHLKGGPSHNDVYPATPKEKADKEQGKISHRSLGESIASRATSTNTQTFGRALAALGSLDESVAGFTGHQIVSLALASTDLSDEDRAGLESLASGQTCATCGHPIEHDPAGENPSTYHHADGEKHDHEAKPSGGESKEGQRVPFVREAADNGQKCPQCGQYEAHRQSTGEKDEDGHDETVLVCDNCDWNVEKVEKQSSLHTASEEVEVASLPTCDIHKFEKGQDGVEAKYDGKTVMGPWANMCEECFQQYGSGLGTGRGQRLVVKSAKTASEDKAKPGEIEDLESGAYQRSKCQNCGDTIRRKGDISGKWQHAKNNSAYCNPQSF